MAAAQLVLEIQHHHQHHDHPHGQQIIIDVGRNDDYGARIIREALESIESDDLWWGQIPPELDDSDVDDEALVEDHRREPICLPNPQDADADAVLQET
jgi:hypothetical protein